MKNNIETIVSIPFPLDKALPQLKKVQYGREVTLDRIENKELRDEWIAVADFSMYEVLKGEAVLRLSDINPGFENVEDFCKQIRKTGNYHPSKKDVERVRKSKTTITVPLSKLDLEKDTDEYCHFYIDTSKDGSQFNKHQRLLVERVYGNMAASSIGRKESDFIAYMKVLKENGISRTRFFTLNPEYVMEHAKKGPIARVSRLDDFDNYSDLFVVSRNVDSNNVRVRGVSIVPIIRPNLTQILRFSEQYVPKACWQEYSAGIEKQFGGKK